jgi:NAD(P)-dependent dehydrogenase (short-subunit alcohol dehydrogenase family)
MRIAITGANRGIGLELVRQLLGRGDTVHAGVRNPKSAEALQRLQREHTDRLSVLSLDVSDDASVRAFSKAIPPPLDVLINNAGVFGEYSSLEETDLDAALEVYSVNALGPLRVTRALLPQLRAGSTRKILHVTSGMASIGDNSSGNAYAYRMSKAALNMASRNLAVELREESFVSCVINPGWVKTDMGGKSAPTEVGDSVKGILQQLDRMAPDVSGEFLDWSGDKKWPW